MKNREKNAALLLAGLVIGGAVTAPDAHAAEEYFRAIYSPALIYVDGKRVELEAYNIDGNNYIKLRVVGAAVGFNVYWDGAVQIEAGKLYTGEAPEEKMISHEMVELINELRRQNGLNELNISDALMATAQERAEICARRGNVEHDKSLTTELLEKHGYAGGAGCNLGSTSWTGAPTTELVSIFKNSPGHLRTMLAEGAEDIGVGVYLGSRVYVAMYIGNENWY